MVLSPREHRNHRCAGAGSYSIQSLAESDAPSNALAASIVGIAGPTTLSDKILIGAFEFGGNFLLYGVVGTALGVAFRLANRAATLKPNH